MRLFARNCLSAVVATSFAVGSLAAPSAAQKRARGVAKASEPAACVSLHKEYEMASKRMALNSARASVAGGMAAMRAQQENAGILAQANTTAGLLRDNKCKAPAHTPSGDRYSAQALQCQTDLINASTAVLRGGAPSRPETCVLENWKAG